MAVRSRRVVPRGGDAQRTHARRLGGGDSSPRPRGAGCRRLRRCAGHIERRVGRAPRYRQKLAPVPLGA